MVIKGNFVHHGEGVPKHGRKVTLRYILSKIGLVKR
jgi:hypothetical protein